MYFCVLSIIGTMEDGLLLIFTSWELLVWSGLGIYELVDSLEFITLVIISQVSLFLCKLELWFHVVTL